MFSSIRIRILAITTLLVVIAFAITGTATYLIVQANQQQSINQDLESLTTGHAMAIDEWVSAKQAAVAAAVIAARSGGPQAAVAQLQMTGGFKVATLGLDDKSAFGMPAPPPGFDPTSRPWYKETAQAGKALVTKPYADVQTKQPMVSFASPVPRESGPNGVLSAAMPLEGVRQVVVSIHPTPASLGFVVDGDGTILAHPDAKFSSKPVSELAASLTPATAATLAQATEPLETALDGTPKLMRAKKIKGTNWYLVVALDKYESQAGLRKVLQTIVVSILIVLTATILVLGMVMTAAFRRLSEVTAAMDEISSGSGDLTLRLPATGKDEVARISGAFNVFVDKINDIMLQVREGSTAIRSATAEIASGNANLSARTETQASSLEETAASMEELTSTVKQNADNARQANALVASASGLASKGGTMVGEVVQTMNSIKASSTKIVEIIAVIDGIAFQTNILALNAAVEAARAGEQGRGFAVVASEVRSLARRAASAAKDINVLISDTVHKVDAGNTLVETAGNTMREVVASVQRVATIMGEITTASHEQSSGIEETNQAISQMDQMTQQNAALVEEAAAATESLGEQAARLTETVAAFKLRQDTAYMATSPVRRRVPGSHQRLSLKHREEPEFSA